MEIQILPRRAREVCDTAALLHQGVIEGGEFASAEEVALTVRRDGIGDEDDLVTPPVEGGVRAEVGLVSNHLREIL